jgi:hypothetical protein
MSLQMRLEAGCCCWLLCGRPQPWLAQRVQYVRLYGRQTAAAKRSRDQPLMAQGGQQQQQQWESFHQQEDLTTRLHNILEEYPVGIGIFKEFLQNADDAGARRFAILYDRGSYSHEGGLLSPEMGLWQGPALYVYNDATFTDSDFESISHVGRSGKLDDVSKIGKYGLGFNVAYHFTDVVSFVTRDQLVVFDPHGTSLPGGLLGLRSNFVDSALRESHPAQAAPFVWEGDRALPFCTCTLRVRQRACACVVGTIPSAPSRCRVSALSTSTCRPNHPSFSHAPCCCRLRM